VNVAIFTDNDFDKVNGVTTTLRAVLTHAPADLNIRVYTAAALPLDTAQYLALPSIGFPIPFYGEMCMYAPPLRGFLRHARHDRIDVVHVTTPGPVGVAALWISRALDVPLIGSFHTDLAAYAELLSGFSIAGRVMRGYLHALYSQCARVLVPSGHTRELLIQSGISADRVQVWSRGVNAALFSPSKRSPRVRERWHVSNRRPAVLYVGRVSWEKGLELLPELEDRLYSLGVQHRFIVTGDGPMLPWLRERMPDAVFTGTLPPAAVAEVFASADVFVFPSRTDTAGNVVLEAQASGLPVIVGGRGGPRENLRPGCSGVVCETADPTAWAVRLAEILRIQPLREEMGRAAREYALTRRWDDAMRPLYNGYRELMAASQRSIAGSTTVNGRPCIWPQ
jgi:glycosyltransferase involved in cell wall biosynthesis